MTVGMATVLQVYSHPDPRQMHQRPEQRKLPTKNERPHSRHALLRWNSAVPRQALIVTSLHGGGLWGRLAPQPLAQKTDHPRFAGGAASVPLEGFEVSSAATNCFSSTQTNASTTCGRLPEAFFSIGIGGHTNCVHRQCRLGGESRSALTKGEAPASETPALRHWRRKSAAGTSTKLSPDKSSRMAPPRAPACSRACCSSWSHLCRSLPSSRNVSWSAPGCRVILSMTSRVLPSSGISRISRRTSNAHAQAPGATRHWRRSTDSIA